MSSNLGQALWRGRQQRRPRNRIETDRAPDCPHHSRAPRTASGGLYRRSAGQQLCPPKPSRPTGTPVAGNLKPTRAKPAPNVSPPGSPCCGGRQSARRSAPGNTGPWQKQRPLLHCGRDGGRQAPKAPAPSGLRCARGISANCAPFEAAFPSPRIFSTNAALPRKIWPSRAFHILGSPAPARTKSMYYGTADARRWPNCPRIHSVTSHSGAASTPTIAR